MKVFIVAISVIAVCLAGESSFAPNTFQYSGNLKSYATTGFDSPRSIYYVQVPAERLQTLRAVGPSPQDSQSFQLSYQRDESGNLKSDATTGFDSPRSIYYVQVPAERLQALRAVGPSPQDSQSFQLSYQRDEAKSAAYSQPLEVEAQFVPLQVVSTEQLAQTRSQE